MNGNQNNNQSGNGSWWENNQNKNGTNNNWWENTQEGGANNNSQWEARQNGPNWDNVNVNFPPFFTSAQQEMAKRKANTSMILGIVGLVLSLFGSMLVGIILGIIAVVKSSTAKKLSATPLTEAKAGKILGILSIIFGALPLVIILIILSATLFLALAAVIFA